MMPRKTCPVDSIVGRANQLLKLEGDSFTPEFRFGVIAMVEGALFQTDNYKGYRYLGSEFFQEGFDDTRRFYHTS